MTLTERVLQLLKQDIQAVPHAYSDQLGYLRVGLHRSIDHRIGGGLSDPEIDLIAKNDIDRIQADMQSLFPYAFRLPAPRTAVLIDLAFSHPNGAAGIVQNKELMTAITQRNYLHAGELIIHSEFGHHQPQRAARLAAMMASGDWPQLHAV